MERAHPLTEPSDLTFPPVVLAGLAVFALLAIVQFWPARRGSAAPSRPGAVDSWEGALSTPQWAARLAALALFVLAVAAARAGADDELENLAPALLIGAGWPLLVLCSVLLGRAWRWTDPWDGAARLLGARDGGGSPGGAGVTPAVISALALTWYLSAFFRPFAPRAVGLAVGGYALIMTAGCLAFGRAGWLSRTDAVGLFLGWAARLPRRLLAAWRPPPGAALVLGVLGGGLLFGAVRRSSLWGRLNIVPAGEAYALLGVTAFAALAAGALHGLSARARRMGAAGSVEAAVVPAVASIALAQAMHLGVFTTSLQLLPGLLLDPFGRGWNPFGWGDIGQTPVLLATTARLVVRLGLLVIGHAAGAVVLARRAAPAARGPGAIALSLLLAASVMAVSTR